MTKTFTPDDLLRYLYQDTTIKETREIENALLLDSNLQDELDQLQSDLNLLGDLTPEPDNNRINHVLGYARAMNLTALCN